MAGLFISFEGGEGSGKTTQVNKIADILTKKKLKVVTTREPGGTQEGDKIRNLIVQRDGGNWTPMAECLLLFASRAMHVDRVIKPALESGKIVISDRFTDSTRAYQGYARGFPLKTIEEVNNLVLGDFKPHLTIIFDIDPEKGLARSDRRLAAEELSLNQTEDRFEGMDLEFHKKLRAGFLDIAKKEPKRCVIVDASLPVEELTKKLESIIIERLK